MVGFSQDEGLNVFWVRVKMVARMRGIPSILGVDRGGQLFAG